MKKSTFFILRFIIVIVSLFIISNATFAQTAISNISEVESAVVAICHTEPLLKNRIGTGFLASPDGMVITADHVIHNRRKIVYDSLYCIRPNYPHHEKYELVLLKRLRRGHTGRDVAILKIKTEKRVDKLPYLSLGETFQTGQQVVVAGFPNVFKAIYLWPLFRKGSVSSIRYKYEDADVVILDIKSLNGYSGAPVIAEKSLHVIGVMKGQNIKSSPGDFSVATPISQTDIEFHK
ncbi:MAG: hypothetical protein AMJ54_09715 [Deltaproteobacteria bacterium SG8_13]|nr:MAG: hypothetical protein AMJ54_09715 [Deltaproteobacteria bacterium SG8_13]